MKAEVDDIKQRLRELQINHVELVKSHAVVGFFMLFSSLCGIIWFLPYNEVGIITHILLSIVLSLIFYYKKSDLHFWMVEVIMEDKSKIIQVAMTRTRKFEFSKEEMEYYTEGHSMKDIHITEITEKMYVYLVRNNGVFMYNRPERENKDNY